MGVEKGNSAVFKTTHLQYALTAFTETMGISAIIFSRWNLSDI